MSEWRKVTVSKIVLQRKPWHRRWLSKEKNEPRQFHAQAYARGPLMGQIIDRGPDLWPAVKWSATAETEYTRCTLERF